MDRGPGHGHLGEQTERKMDYPGLSDFNEEWKDMSIKYDCVIEQNLVLELKVQKINNRVE